MRKKKLASFVFLAFNVNLNGIPYLQVWIVTEFVKTDYTLRLVTNVYNHFPGCHLNHSTSNHFINCNS